MCGGLVAAILLLILGKRFVCSSNDCKQALFNESSYVTALQSTISDCDERMQ